MVNTQETIHLESIDTILNNLKKDKNFYNHAMTETAWMQEEQRE